MPVDKIRYFPPLGWGITQKGVGEYFEDYPTFVYKADVGGFHQKKSVYIATWVKTAFVTQWVPTRRKKFVTRVWTPSLMAVLLVLCQLPRMTVIASWSEDAQ